MIRNLELKRSAIVGWYRAIENSAVLDYFIRSSIEITEALKTPIKYLDRVITGYIRWNTASEKLNSTAGQNSRVVYFNLRENRYERYLYLLVKFFLLEGFTVCFKKSFRFIGDLEKYSLWLLKEPHVRFCSEIPADALLVIEDDNETGNTFISSDYFTSMQHLSTKNFHVPMAMHPYMYKDDYWNERLLDQQRFKSIIFAGCLKREAYSRISETACFDIRNRIELFDLLHHMNEFELPANLEALNDCMTHGKIVVVDRGRFSIPMNQLRSYLSKFEFFLACPGVSMPYSHNIVEAMSCGCIPVIERSYAELFIPSLINGANALIFEGNRESFYDILNQALRVNEAKVRKMRESVFEYYRQYLTPEKVVRKILEHPQNIFLNAEAYSVRKYRKMEKKMNREIPEKESLVPVLSVAIS